MYIKVTDYQTGKETNHSIKEYVEECLKNSLSEGGQFERLQAQVNKNSEAIGILVEILYRNDCLTSKQILEISQKPEDTIKVID